MFSTTHTSIGASIMLLMPNEYGILLAFLSHLPTDILQERWPSTLKKLAIRELVITTAQVSIAIYFDKFLLLIIGLIAANMIDFVDKTLKFVFKRNEVFPCHQRWWPGINLKSYEITCFFDLILFIMFFIAVTA